VSEADTVVSALPPSVFAAEFIISAAEKTAGAVPAGVSLNHQPTREVRMSPQVRPLAGFKNLADQQLVTTASAIVTEMTDNANFPNPPVDLKTLATAVDDLSAAMAAQVQGGTASTALKKNKRATVIDLLVKLAHHVHDNCG